MFENTKINEKEAGDGPFKKIQKVKMGTREKDEARIDLLRLSNSSVHGTLRSWFFLSPNGIELKISKQIKTVDWIFEIGPFPASLSLFCSFRCSCQKMKNAYDWIRTNDWGNSRSINCPQPLPWIDFLR